MYNQPCVGYRAGRAKRARRVSDIFLFCSAAVVCSFFRCTYICIYVCMLACFLFSFVWLNGTLYVPTMTTIEGTFRRCSCPACFWRPGFPGAAFASPFRVWTLWARLPITPVSREKRVKKSKKQLQRKTEEIAWLRFPSPCCFFFSFVKQDLCRYVPHGTKNNRAFGWSPRPCLGPEGVFLVVVMSVTPCLASCSLASYSST